MNIKTVHVAAVVLLALNVGAVFAQGVNPAIGRDARIEPLSLPMSIDTQTGWITCLQFLPHSQSQLISGADNGALTLWDLHTRKALWSVCDEQNAVTAVTCSADGKRIAAGHWNGSIAIHDAGGRLLASLRSHTESVTALAFSPDGRHLASGSADDTLKVWNLSASTLLRTLESGNDYDITAVAFSPDGSSVAAGDGENTVRVWDAATGDEQLALNGHESVISGVAFSPDGRHLVSASWDHDLILWDARTGRQANTLHGHMDEISCVAFTPAGAILSGSTDGTVRVWHADGRCAAAFSLSAAPTRFAALAFSRDGLSVAVSSQGRLHLWTLPRAITNAAKPSDGKE